MRRGLTLFNTTSIAFGLAFLYLPIVILVIYSFNASRLVAVWGGWSTRWYAALLDDRAMLDATAASFDRSLEEAAMDLGCPPMRTFMTVTLPLTLPAIVAGFLLAFSLSLDDLVIASFTTGPGATTLPMRIYSEVRLGVKPEINAICTLVIGLIAIVIVIASLAAKLSSPRSESAAPL